MDRQKKESVLLRLWKESCQHIEIAESWPRIAQALREAIPFETVMVRFLETNQSQIYTIAEYPIRDSANDYKRQLAPADGEQLRRWCQSDRVLRRGKRMTGNLGLMIPFPITEDVIAVPLHQQATNAVLMFVAPKDVEFEDDHIELATIVSEPIAVAIANHHRLHEIATLREAAEADKGALLKRLGRTDLGDQIIGEESGLKTVIQRVQLVVGSDVPVLILGETGAGKELIARALHTRGPRRDGPFIRVNCGAIPPELIDSQLFGHEKGAFTGADQSRQGWFERADGGTLFLDEIGELPLDAQVRFLRVLQDGFVERVGSTLPVHVDVRVVAATHRDLASMVAQGKFREDLWYRVAVFPILLPPLRERKNDIGELALHFAARAANRFSLTPVIPSASDIELLKSYHWPGNIRELGAVIDRAAILGDGKSLEIAASLGISQEPSQGKIPDTTIISRGVANHQSFDRSHSSPITPHTEPPIDSDLSLDLAMRAHIERVLELTNGKVEGPDGAANRLKINPHTLRARMRKLGVKWARFRKYE